MGIKSRADTWAVSARRKRDVTVFAVITAAVFFAALAVAAVIGKIDGFALVVAIGVCVSTVLQLGRRMVVR